MLSLDNVRVLYVALCLYTFYICFHTHAGGLKLTWSRRSSTAHVFHGVPEAPCVGPKYYTQTVAITSKPEIPHSTFLIPAARPLSWAPHEEPLLERGRGVMYLSLFLSVSVCLSVSCSLSALLLPALSLRPYIFHCHSLHLWLSCSVYLSISPSAGLSISLLLIPPLLRCALSPTLPLRFSAVLHVFVYFLLYLARPPVSDWCCLSVALLPSTRPSLCFLLLFPLSLSHCIPLSVSPSPSPSASPDIHVEIFSHVRYRFMTPARSLWPLNLIPSTKPHCFFVCLGLSVVCDCG